MEIMPTLACKAVAKDSKRRAHSPELKSQVVVTRRSPGTSEARGTMASTPTLFTAGYTNTTLARCLYRAGGACASGASFRRANVGPVSCKGSMGIYALRFVEVQVQSPWTGRFTVLHCVVAPGVLAIHIVDLQLACESLDRLARSDTTVTFSMGWSQVGQEQDDIEEQLAF